MFGCRLRVLENIWHSYVFQMNQAPLRNLFAIFPSNFLPIKSYFLKGGNWAGFLGELLETAYSLRPPLVGFLTMDDLSFLSQRFIFNHLSHLSFQKIFYFRRSRQSIIWGTAVLGLKLLYQFHFFKTVNHTKKNPAYGRH